MVTERHTLLFHAGLRVYFRPPLERDRRASEAVPHIEHRVLTYMSWIRITEHHRPVAVTEGSTLTLSQTVCGLGCHTSKSGEQL
jgi:hypothetical protein